MSCPPCYIISSPSSHDRQCWAMTSGGWEQSNLNLVTVSMAWLPSAHHLLLLLVTTTSISCVGAWSDCEQAVEEKLFCIITSRKRVAVTGGQHGGEMSRRQLLSSPPPPPNKRDPLPFPKPPRSPCQDC